MVGEQSEEGNTSFQRGLEAISSTVMDPSLRWGDGGGVNGLSSFPPGPGSKTVGLLDPSERRRVVSGLPRQFQPVNHGNVLRFARKE